MRERDDDIQGLAELIQRSNESAGEFLRSAFEIPEKTLTAAQLVRKLQGTITVVLATVSSTGSPRTAPVLALFYRAAFCIPTVQTALRTRHVRRNPAVSLSLYEGNDFAVIAHGDATLVGPESSDFDELVGLQLEHNGGDVRDWGDPLYIRVNAERLYTFARYPERFREQR